MTKSRLAALGAALVALGAAAAPAHAAWRVTEITTSESFLRGVDARPDRVPLILDGGSGERVDAFDWAPGAAAPGPVQTISQARFSGAPALLARAEIVFIAWTETTASNAGPHTMRVARFGPGGVAPTTTYTSSDHNLGKVAGIPVLQALPGTAVRAYYRPSRSARTYTVTFGENGRARGAALVAERTNADIVGALARNGSLLAWTRKLGTTNASYRVQKATP